MSFPAALDSAASSAPLGSAANTWILGFSAFAATVMPDIRPPPAHIFKCETNSAREHPNVKTWNEMRRMCNDIPSSLFLYFNEIFLYTHACFFNYNDAAKSNCIIKLKYFIHFLRCRNPGYYALRNGHRAPTKKRKEGLYTNKVHVLGILNSRGWKFDSDSCMFWLCMVFYH